MQNSKKLLYLAGIALLAYSIYNIVFIKNDYRRFLLSYIKLMTAIKIIYYNTNNQPVSALTAALTSYVLALTLPENPVANTKTIFLYFFALVAFNKPEMALQFMAEELGLVPRQLAP